MTSVLVTGSASPSPKRPVTSLASANSKQAAGITLDGDHLTSRG
ncbi:hypothetical protein OG948_51070 (plasmid) [Embleya sp. NBC_00888]|nr:hypothetical protein OG948_51070 [Embleya sp. NBC_00888]